MTPFTLWTVLWVNPDGDGFHYRTKPADFADDGPEVRRYCADDVIRFKAMMDRLGIEGLSFKCLSNIEIPGIETVPLACPDLPGWWAKMELFRPGVADERNVYCDLDTVVLSLEGIPTFPAPFAAIKPGKKVGSNFMERWIDKEGRLRLTGFQTSVMVWDGAYGFKFWDRFNSVPAADESGFSGGGGLTEEAARAAWMARLASDQDFLFEQFGGEAKMFSRWFAKIRICDPAWRARVRVIISTPHKNDSAARLYPWIAPYWHGPGAIPPIKLPKAPTKQRLK